MQEPGTNDIQFGSDSGTASTAAAADAARDAAELALKRARVSLAASIEAEAAAKASAVAAAQTANAVQAAAGGGSLAFTNRGNARSSSSTSGRADEMGFGGGGAEDLASLQISFGTADTDETEGEWVDDRPAGRTAARNSDAGQKEDESWPKTAVVPPREGPDLPGLSGRSEGTTAPLAGKIQTARRLELSSDIAGVSRTGQEWGEDTIDWDNDGQESAQWLMGLLLSGPGMSGLVVDMWSPGALFLRHVEVGSYPYQFMP